MKAFIPNFLSRIVMPGWFSWSLRISLILSSTDYSWFFFCSNMKNRNYSIEINEILIRNYHLSILDLKFPILDTSSQKSISKNISSYMILAAGKYFLLGSFSTFRISKNFSNLFLIRSWILSKSKEDIGMLWQIHYDISVCVI